jgi:hypothetical protein
MSRFGLSSSDRIRALAKDMRIWSPLNVTNVTYAIRRKPYKGHSNVAADTNSSEKRPFTWILIIAPLREEIPRTWNSGSQSHWVQVVLAAFGLG